MYQFHVRAQVRPGSEKQYEEWKIREGELQRKAPGFIKRIMLRDRQNAGVYYYISFWDAKEQSQAFAATPAFQELHKRLAPANTFSVPQELFECEVVFDEVAEQPG